MDNIHVIHEIFQLINLRFHKLMEANSHQLQI